MWSAALTAAPCKSRIPRGTSDYGCAEPQLGETSEPNAKEALCSIFTLGKETRGIEAPQSFSLSQVSQLVDRKGQPSFVRCLGLICAHSTQVWRSDQIEV